MRKKNISSGYCVWQKWDCGGGESILEWAFRRLHHLRQPSPQTSTEMFLYASWYWRESLKITVETFREEFGVYRWEFNMRWYVKTAKIVLSWILMATKESHCLNESCIAGTRGELKLWKLLGVIAKPRSASLDRLSGIKFHIPLPTCYKKKNKMPRFSNWACIDDAQSGRIC